MNAAAPGILVGSGRVPDEGGDVNDSQTLRDLVRSAREALAELGRARDAGPVGMDRFDWSADLLDELARVAIQRLLPARASPSVERKEATCS